MKEGAPLDKMGAFAGLLGIIDLLSAAALFLYYFGHPVGHLQAGMGFALIMKGVMFITDILSWLDIIIGVAMFVLFWIEAPNIALIGAIWLVYKGIHSWF